MREFLQRRPRVARLTAEVGRFGSVGAIAYVVQLGVTNLLWGVGTDPLAGQVVGTACAIAIAFVGNRFWTYRDRARTGYARETVLFLVMNGVGMLLQLGCQGFAVYVLALEGQLAHNVAGNVVGVGLGTLFRFWSYRTWVFPPQEPIVWEGSDEAVRSRASSPSGADPARNPNL
ncbi:GtrA family protein [Nocardiopsis sp. EMB25]|uniref:GtrA family protein n=1 Tax=Nocardiopsis TaxID=2013 RepID=UPI0003474871|nr:MULTISPECIES: GtrA family protein [Nocardiopsis]MCY9785716.1 GtrA family protein [Nocardiopsis sp. EMB25]